MTSSPVRCPSPVGQQAPHTRHDGNLARANTRAGLFSFFVHEPPHKFGAHNSDCHEAGASLSARGTGAAHSRHSCRPAESRPFPSLHVYDVGHWCFSRLHIEKYLVRFPKGGKILPKIGKILPKIGKIVPGTEGR